MPTVQLQNKRKYELNRIERKRMYFRDCFFIREGFMERKMTSIVPLLHSRYEESVNEQIKCEKQFGVKLFLLKSLREVMSSNLLMNLVLIAYLLYEVLIKQSLKGSDFIATYNAVNVLMNGIMQIIMLWGKISASAYTVGVFWEFILQTSVLDYEDINKANMQIVSSQEEILGLDGSQGGDFAEIHSIEFRNVSFAYPGTERTVLRNISFCIHSGEKIAIVGKNGSGKTTLIHLLMGLYHPTKGEIFVNGQLLTREEYPLYREKFAAFFQGMKPLEATVAENVAMDINIDLSQVSEALQKANCRELFCETEKTMIGVQFDSSGLILSGGECQRLMLAHCFYSNKDMLVLDEPSSALDPMAEREFNLQVSQLSGDKLVVFVTHRLSTVHMADYIYVIDDGILCNQGSHEALMKVDGVYRDMWNIQAEKYGGL